MIEERDLRDMLRRRADAIPADPVAPPFVARRARRRIARETGTVVLLTVALVFAWMRVAPSALSPAPHLDEPIPTASEPVPSPSLDPTPDLVGFSGFPAAGAAPSLPEVGRLIGSFTVESDRKVGSDYEKYLEDSIEYFVYADGRLIWQMGRETDAATGWLEQRLTSTGVEMLRSQSASVKVPVPASWLTGRLPDEAWADRTIRAFVPARFQAVMSFLGAGQRTPADPSVLSPPADRLLREADEVDRWESCTTLTLEEALRVSRQFGESFDTGLGLSLGALLPLLPHEVHCSIA